MLLKRKRSESELGSVFSSGQQTESGCFNFDAMSAMDTARRGFFAPRLSTPSHLHSRTRKRFRDNRPSESEVYQHTLDVLYSAQRRPHELHHTLPQPPTTASSAIPSQPHLQSHHGGHQRSLHSFWNLPGPSSSTDSFAPSPASDASTTTPSPPSPALAPRSISTSCEDCGADLGAGDDDAMMDIDGYGPSLEDHTCGACGKTVCFSCSVSNLGEHRRCLACARPRSGGYGGVWVRS